jgi:acyl-CoA synthetase (AMP-forming)/AMP-acid ligase II
MSILSRAATLGDVLRGQAAERPHKVALETLQGARTTFGELNARVNRLNNAVAALGMRKRTRAAILSRNRPEYLEVYGLSKSGLIVVPLNWRLAAPELAKLLAHSEPEILFVDEAHRELAESLRAQLPFVRHFVLVGNAATGWIGYEQLLASAAATEPAQAAQPDDVLSLIYTSGTTGAPKGVAVTHAGALGNARTAAGEMLGLTDQDHTMAVMPLFHVGGMWYHAFPSIAAGCTTLLLSEFDSGTVLRELQARRITNVHLVPTMIGALLANPAAASADLSQVRLLFYAASSMPAELLRRAMDTFPACGFAQAYGSTEAGIVSVLDPAAHRRARAAAGEHLLLSCGRPCSGHAVRIVDADDQAVDQGCIGEIELRSPDVMKGYWHQDQATQAVLREGWLKTGDLGYVDAEGFLYIVDRKNDMIVTGGENVYPTEVEGVLYRDPAVLEAAVFGIPDPLWVEKVVAAVVLRPGVDLSEQDLLQRLRGQLAGYKCPKSIYFTASLPKSAVGKVLRKTLRQQYGSP